MIPVDPRPRPVPRRYRQVEEPPDAPPTPYGPYRAAHSLVAIVAEIGSRELERKLARSISEYLFGLNQLEHLPSDRFRKWMIERFANDYRQHLMESEVEKAQGRVRDAWTHLVCVVAAHARDRIRQINVEIHEDWLEMTRERRAAMSRRDRAKAGQKPTPSDERR